MTREEEINRAAVQIAKEWYCGREDEFYLEVAKLEEMGKWIDEHPQNPWRDANTELPESHQNEGCDYSEELFLRIQNGQYVAYIAGGYDFGNKQWVIELRGKTEKIPHVTHWMPIPPAKKGGAE